MEHLFLNLLKYWVKTCLQPFLIPYQSKTSNVYQSCTQYSNNMNVNESRINTSNSYSYWNRCNKRKPRRTVVKWSYPFHLHDLQKWKISTEKQLHMKHLHACFKPLWAILISSFPLLSGNWRKIIWNDLTANSKGENIQRNGRNEKATWCMLTTCHQVSMSFVWGWTQVKDYHITHSYFHQDQNLCLNERRGLYRNDHYRHFNSRIVCLVNSRKLIVMYSRKDLTLILRIQRFTDL